jgi:hypothetical protein
MTAPTLSKIIIPERPSEAPSALPGDELVVTGSGFGSTMDSKKSAVLIGTDGTPAVTAEIVTWGDQQIRFRFPGGLGDPGPKALRVRAQQGTSNPLPVALEGPPQLSSAPVALLPLALQTRFMADGRELWVRAIPDTVHIDSHDERLTAEEIQLGERYRDAGDGRGGVWLDLTTRFGAPRAEWIVRATLAKTVVKRDQVWALAARTRLLPRRLYAFAYGPKDELLVSQYGRPIPFELPIGPDPSAPASTDPMGDPGIAWTVDFAEALARGMAMKLRLSDPLPTSIERLIVVGVETTLTPQQGASEFGDALAAHRYTRGIGFLPEGTPTNVTPSVAADPGDAAQAPPPDVLVQPAAGTNADAAARALGLTARSTELFAGTPYADGGAGLRDARGHMNAALWPATWGYFLEHMMAPIVPHAAIEPARQHFVDWVRGCGPQPVLRIGEQPYGILPVLSLDRWKPQGDQESAISALPGFLRSVLQPIWLDSALTAMPRVSGEPPDDTSPTPQENPLLTVLSLQPRSISYRGRSVLGVPFVDAAWRFIRNAFTDHPDQKLDDAWRTAQGQLAHLVLQAHGLDTWHPYVEQTVFAASYFPIDLPLVQSGTIEPSEWLGYLNTAGWQDLRQDSFRPDDSNPRPLLYLLLRHSLLTAYLFAAGELESAGEVGPPDLWRGGEPVLYGIDDDLGPPPPMAWDRLTALSKAGPAKGDVLDQKPEQPLAAVRDGIAQLASAPVEILEPAAAETLDLCSHRLDTWISSFAQRRLHALRDGTEDGVHLGAYGIVENIKRGDGSTSAGYVHTPSPSHAAAAAILASGYRSHPEGSGPRRPFAVDLSSERVRVALSILDGIRAGEPLGGLLGYRFERALHEPPFAGLIDKFRQYSSLPVTGTDPSSTTARAVGACNVVDALQLHREWMDAKRSIPDGWIGDGRPLPADPPQNVKARVQAVLEEIDDRIDALGDILLTEGVYQLARGNSERAAAALQAAAQPSATPPELEAIYTPHSGVATIHRLAVLLPGNAVPAASWSPDPALARRAAAEPRLEAWAGRLLGDPKRVHFRVQYQDPAGGDPIEAEHRLDQLQPALSPLDVVYAAVASEQTQLSELEQRIVYCAARPEPEGFRPAGVPPNARIRVINTREPENDQKISLLDLMELAQALRETLGGARSITPGDLSLPEVAGSAQFDASEVEARAGGAANALQDVNATLPGAITALEDALRAPDPALAGPAGEALRKALLGASALGIPGAVPRSAFGDDRGALADLQVQAGVVQGNVGRRLAELKLLDAPVPKDLRGRAERAIARIQAVFGGDFRAVPCFTKLPRGDLKQVDVGFPASATPKGADSFAATLWFQRLTRVRDGARRLGDLLLYAEALAGASMLQFQVAQLPVVAGDPWLALPFSGSALPAGRVSLVAHLPCGPLPATTTVAGPVAGLLIEQFTEVLPAPTKTTGLAFHYDQPNAAPPQAIVLAVPPAIGEGWTLAALESLVRDTLDLAKVRMVDLSSLQQAGHFVPATYLAFNAKGVTVATDFLTGSGLPLG